jgi:DNA-binding NtrC family response regulator
VVAESTATRSVLRQVAQAARTSMPVLLTGETGTGKEVAARLLHAWSRRSGRFVPINCAAIPNELMEGELFGYARGAFSGAVHEHDGLVSAATGGTVFLDEIDDTPHALQAKLLRVLEDRVVTRLGDSTPRTVDFRLVAATNRDLRPLIESGAFGADLYERLAIVSIELPPLRERRDDIPRLVEHFIERFYREEPAAVERGRVQTVSPEAMEVLVAHRWPGNVRELRNAIFGALVGKRAGSELLLSDLPRRLLGAREPNGRGVIDVVSLKRALGSGAFDLRAEKERLERLALEQALSLARGNAARAAELLGAVGRGEASDPGGTVRAMMRRLGMRPRRRRSRRA